MPRRVFRRIVVKKNGTIRPAFHAWLTEQPGSAPAALLPRPLAESLPNPAVEFLERLQTLDERCEAWRHARKPDRILSREELEGSLPRQSDAWMVLSVGHDDYTRVTGGVQICIQREQEATCRAGGTYLNIHPWQPLPRLSYLEDEPDPLFVLKLDSVELGVCRFSDLRAALGSIAECDVSISVVVHHLLGHSPEHVVELVRAARAPGCMLWLHDFFTLCPSYRLERNDLEFCAAPSVKSNACTLCVYGEERHTHLERMGVLFSGVPVTLLAPSQVTLDLWQRRSELPVADAHVVPHVVLTWSRRPVRVPRLKKGPVRVAFLGAPSPHKGWPIFQRLSYDPALIDDFDFFALSAEKVKLHGKRVRVRVTPERPNAMADTVAAMSVDLVVHWPSWSETFSLTTYEALQGGAYVVTNANSGNIAATVQDTQRGAVLQDEADLFSFFQDGRACELATRARYDRATHVVSARMSDLSVSFFSREVA